MTAEKKILHDDTISTATITNTTMDLCFFCSCAVYDVCK